jgi:hypothetical protein
MTAVIEQVHVRNPASLRRPLPELLDVVENAANTSHKRGLALEAVSVQVVRLVGARLLGWRVRGTATGGAEVDVVADTVQPPYLLIQIQSKASAINGREVIDREVGVATALKSNVILFVTAKNVGAAARRAAAMHMRETALAILFLAGADLRGGLAGITAAMRREWAVVRKIRSERGQERTHELDVVTREVVDGAPA